MRSVAPFSIGVVARHEHGPVARIEDLDPLRLAGQPKLEPDRSHAVHRKPADRRAGRRDQRIVDAQRQRLAGAHDCTVAHLDRRGAHVEVGRVVDRAQRLAIDRGDHVAGRRPALANSEPGATSSIRAPSGVNTPRTDVASVLKSAERGEQLGARDRRRRVGGTLGRRRGDRGGGRRGRRRGHGRRRGRGRRRGHGRRRGGRGDGGRRGGRRGRTGERGGERVADLGGLADLGPGPGPGAGAGPGAAAGEDAVLASATGAAGAGAIAGPGAVSSPAGTIGRASGAPTTRTPPSPASIGWGPRSTGGPRRDPRPRHRDRPVRPARTGRPASSARRRRSARRVGRGLAVGPATPALVGRREHDLGCPRPTASTSSSPDRPRPCSPRPSRPWSARTCVPRCWSNSSAWWLSGRTLTTRSPTSRRRHSRPGVPRAWPPRRGPSKPTGSSRSGQGRGAWRRGLQAAIRSDSLEQRGDDGGIPTPMWPRLHTPCARWTTPGSITETTEGGSR